MPSSKALEIELRVDAALRLRVTQLERALAQTEADHDKLLSDLRVVLTRLGAGGDHAPHDLVPILGNLVDLAQRDRDQAWQVCAQLAAALRGARRVIPWGWRSGISGELSVIEADAALELVQVQCEHPLTAITHNPDGTQSCRACAALATEEV